MTILHGTDKRAIKILIQDDPSKTAKLLRIINMEGIEHCIVAIGKLLEKSNKGIA